MSNSREIALNTFKVEAQAIEGLAARLTADFETAVEAMLTCKGRVIVTGMGKSGLVGTKVAATLASTGTPSFFLHPGEAYHGDLGMIAREDIVLAISNSGYTDEILKLIPFLEDNGNIIVAMTGDKASSLAKHAHYHLDVGVAEEACPLSLAPTSSTTAALVMGDALAVALMHRRGFKEEDFARFHPGGSLGRKLLTKVGDVMRRENLPIVPPATKLSEVIIAISNARLGVAVIMDGERICGLITDGDVRRAMQRYREKFFDLAVEEVMTREPKMVAEDTRVVEAEEIMRQHKIHSLLVTDYAGSLAGIVEMYDLMNGGSKEIK